jgi:hypothetical protein
VDGKALLKPFTGRCAKLQSCFLYKEVCVLEFIGMVILPFVWFWLGVYIGVKQERRRNTNVGTPSALHNKQSVPCSNCGDGRFLRQGETCLWCWRVYK